MKTPQITLRPIEDLALNPRNAKKHPPKQVKEIKASLLAYGWTVPVLADKKGVVAGHGRIAAAKELCAEGQALAFPGGGTIPIGMIPVIDCEGWTPVQRRAYCLADNRIQENGEWDLDILGGELEFLNLEGFGLGSTGFSDKTDKPVKNEKEASQASPDVIVCPHCLKEIEVKR